MHDTTPQRLGRSLVLAAATLSLGCAVDRPLGPEAQRALAGERPASASPDGARGVELGSCPTLQAPAGSKLAVHVYAAGVQIYRWSGTEWSFVAPEAVLSADAGGNGRIGIHYAGPTWESVSGSKVVGVAAERCTPDPTAIPWLSLTVASSAGPGIFHRVTFIQRVNTVGGTAPSHAGSFAGEEARVPYTAEYFFYRTK